MSEGATVTTHEDHGHPTGWRRFVFSTNHKDIGTMYLVFAVVGGIVGTVMSILIRRALALPGDGVKRGGTAVDRPSPPKQRRVVARRRVGDVSTRRLPQQ